MLREKVIPFFERYVVPFSCKRETFERFREVVEAMERGEHRVPLGLAEIVRKVYAMNPNSKGKARSRPLERCLRESSEAIRRTSPPRDEEMVQSSWRHGG